MEKYIENKFLRLILLFVIGVFLQFNNIVIAQEVSRPGTQISDNTAPHSLEPLTFSILDLNSAEKGFLMPRMTTAERMRIPTQELVGGMAIYNTTIDCIEFYNTTRQKWMSTCGDVEPAIFTIPDDKCSSIVPSGEYAEKVFLDSRKNLIAIEVNVSAAGTYNIEAIAYDNDEKLNGYSFAAQGVFPSEGNFTVILKGHGTPKKGYPRNVDGTPTAKDTIVFLFNNKEVSCKVSNIVDTKAITYDLVEVIQSGEFFTKVNVVDSKTTGKITVKINNISQAGIVEIKTATQNGISFSGRKVLNQSEVNSRTATIDLIASGVPSTPAKLPFDFVSNSYVRHEDGEPAKKITKIVAISPVNVTSDCKGAIFGKEFKVNEVLTSEHIITVPVKVTATGRGRVIGTIATGNGQTELIEYASEILDFVFNAANTDVMNIELKPISGTGKPKVGGRNLVMKLQLESKGLKEYIPSEVDEKILKDICSLDVPVKSSWAEIDYSNVSIKFYSAVTSVTTTDPIFGGPMAYATPRTKMDGEGDFRFYIQVNGLQAKSAGAWNISVTSFNGVEFKANGNFTQTQVDNNTSISVNLFPYGESETDREEIWLPVMAKTDSGTTKLGDVRINYVYRPMTIYSIGHQAWHPGGDYNNYNSGPDLTVNSSSNFGWKGTVRIDGLVSLSSPGSTGNRNDFSNNRDLATFNSNLDEADIFVNGGYNYDRSSDQMTSLINKINTNKLAVIFTEDNSSNAMNNMVTFLNRVGGANGSYSTSSFTSAGDKGYQTLTNKREITSPEAANALFSNRFMVLHPPTSGQTYTMEGANVASGYRGGFYLSSTPYGFDVLAKVSDTSIFAVTHQTKGVVAVFAEAFMGGRENVARTSKTYANYTRAKGIPDTHTGYDMPTYNSYFLLNLMHWAIDYTQRNNP